MRIVKRLPTSDRWPLADIPSQFTGIYQALIGPSVEFVVKKLGQKLRFEIPGQEQADMLSDGNNRDHFREIQNCIPLEC